MRETRTFESGLRPRIFMAAGEVSGDRQAGHLASAIRAQDPDVILYGTGGNKMREAGVDIRIQTSQFGSVGFQESARYVRPLRRVMTRVRSLIRFESPDVAVLVDNEGFNGLLAKFLYQEGIPFIYYFPPQVWLWGEWRAKSIAQKARAIIPAFAAEAEIYRREGGRVQWYGHPLLDIVRVEPDCESTLTEMGINPAAPMIGLMPGSRFQELEQLTIPMLSATSLIKEQHPNLQIIIPLAAPHLRPALQRMIDRVNITYEIKIVTSYVYSCLSRCKLLILSSGTATLEGALLGIPMVVAYKVSPVTFFLARHLVKSRFIAMPNILLDGGVVPELMQHEVTAERLAAEALAILQDEERSKTMRDRLAGIRPKLGRERVISRAAAFVLEEARASQVVHHAELI